MQNSLLLQYLVRGSELHLWMVLSWWVIQIIHIRNLKSSPAGLVLDSRCGGILVRNQNNLLCAVVCDCVDVCDCMVYPDPNFLIFKTKNSLIFFEDRGWFFWSHIITQGICNKFIEESKLLCGMTAKFSVARLKICQDRNFETKLGK